MQYTVLKDINLCQVEYIYNIIKNEQKICAINTIFKFEFWYECFIILFIYMIIFIMIFIFLIWKCGIMQMSQCFNNNNVINAIKQNNIIAIFI